MLTFDRQLVMMFWHVVLQVEAGKQSAIKLQRVLSGLRPWEICSPDVSAAIEFCRERIVEMPVDEYEKWFSETFPTITRPPVVESSDHDKRGTDIQSNRVGGRSSSRHALKSAPARLHVVTRWCWWQRRQWRRFFEIMPNAFTVSLSRLCTLRRSTETRGLNASYRHDVMKTQLSADFPLFRQSLSDAILCTLFTVFCRTLMRPGHCCSEIVSKLILGACIFNIANAFGR